MGGKRSSTLSLSLFICAYRGDRVICQYSFFRSFPCISLCLFLSLSLSSSSCSLCFFSQAVSNAFRSIGRWFRRRFHERWFSKKQRAKIQEEMKRQDEKLKAAQKSLMDKRAHDLVDQVVPEEDVDYDRYLDSVPPPDASLVAATVVREESDDDAYYNDDSHWEVDGAPRGTKSGAASQSTQFLEIAMNAAAGGRGGGEAENPSPEERWIPRIQPRRRHGSVDVKRHQFLLARMSDL